MADSGYRREIGFTTHACTLLPHEVTDPPKPPPTTIQQADVKTVPGRGRVRSVLLNANPEDTGSLTRRLRLTLGYAASLDKVQTK
jgi:hypothetical protein